MIHRTLINILITAFMTLWSLLAWSSDSIEFNHQKLLDFQIVTHTDSPPITITRYHHQSSIGVELISKYQFSNWLSLSLDMDGQEYPNQPAQQAINFKEYSASAQMGRDFMFRNSSLRPFAQIGFGFSESNATRYNANHYEKQTFDNTDLQYGLGLRYSRNDWNSFGVSLIYENQSKLRDHRLPRFDTSLQSADSIGLNVDFGF